MRSILFTFVFALVSFVSFAQNFDVQTITENIVSLNNAKNVSLSETKGTRNFIHTIAHCQCSEGVKKYLVATYQPKNDGGTLVMPIQTPLTINGNVIDYIIEYKIEANFETYNILKSMFVEK